MTDISTRDATKSPIFAYTAPFLVFMGFLALVPVVEKMLPASVNPWLSKGAFLVYPVQTLVCAVLLWKVRKKIEFRGFAYPSVIFAIGFFVFAIWTAPQFFHWIPPRTDGFNPDLFAGDPFSYWTTVSLRFLRLVIVVPLLEEIFWRGFLMRFLISEPFEKVPFGKYQTKAFFITVLAFAAAHYGNSALPGQDFYAAIITGVIYNGVACLTKSLGSCVFVHAVTNLFLGLYIMFTKQWGFW